MGFTLDGLMGCYATQMNQILYLFNLPIEFLVETLYRFRVEKFQLSYKCFSLQQEDDLEKAHRAYLAPPMPPVMTSSRLRRVNSSTLSLNRTKKKLLTVEELYVEILYTVLHMIGCDIDQVSFFVLKMKNNL